MKRSEPMKRTAFKSKPRAPGQRAALKTRQRARTPADIELHDRLADEVGCIACMKDGRRNTHVSIHHIDGRTKPGCHALVLPLCAGHHQDGTGEDKSLLAVHPWKARFEKRYGAQLDLLAECMHLLNLKGMP